MKKVILILLILTAIVSAQIPEIKNFELFDGAETIPHSFTIQNSENDLLFFWVDSTDLLLAKSSDDGVTWNYQQKLVDNSIVIDTLTDVNALVMSSGRILLTYKFKRHQLIFSDDNGTSWSDPIELPAEEGIIRPRLVSNSSLTETSDGKIWFVYSRSNTAHTHSANVFSIKSEDGQTWAAQRDTLIDNLNFTTHGTVISANPDSLLLFYQHAQPGDRNDIYKKVSTDGGENWSEPVTIIDTVLNKFRPRIIKQSDGSIWLFYQAGMETPFEEFDQVDIFYSVSRDNGKTWSEPVKFTNYVGFDGWHNVGLVNDEPFVSFVSSRGQQLITNRIWYGTSSSIDTYTPPVIYSHNFTFINNYPLININVKVKAYDDNAIASLYFNYKLTGGELTELELFDDGLHNDELPGDFIYGNTLEGLPYQYNLDYFFVITDIDANTAETITNNLSSPFNDPPTKFAFDNNNIWLPINNYGRLADARVTSPTGEQRSMGWFDESRFIYSGGFALSGYNNGELWANGVMSSSRVEDYLPGKVGSNPGDDINRIYVLRSSHQPFTLSWLEWIDAVDLGANFYDGDGDGEYNPVDLNGNGEWDTNEDRPDLIGDITAWCVYNDGVPSGIRSFENVAPQGIEIKQTVFSYNKNDSPELSNAIFIRYNIENTGTVSDKFDSVYFAGWADGDLGEYNDDLVGTDTLLNSIYMYNEGPDGEYGNNPPTFYLSQLQGAHSYIPGETFIDINGNGLYEDGIDTPLDTANVLRGEIIGIKEYPGAKNANITSSYSLRSGHPTAGDSDNEIQLRYNMEGKDQRGLFLDPCQWEYAQVIDEDCNSVNPAFWYSGDPVINKGWICIEPDDQRYLISSGPFILEAGKPVEIITAYILGRGVDAINSIEVARDITKDVIGFYSTNFSYIPVGVAEETKNILPTKFTLSQNYPNPFNPSTRIEYSIPSSVISTEGRNLGDSSPNYVGIRNDNVNVMLKVYDILGREVATLVDKEQKPGNYEVEFNANKFSSGVYFYTLKVGSFLQTKKMLLLR